MIVLCIALLTAAPALRSSESPSPAPACDPTDLRCTGDHYAKAARAATTGKERARLALAASRAYLGLFRETGERRDLCKARQLVVFGLAQPGEHLREHLKRSAKEVQTELSRLGAHCQPAARQSDSVPPLLESPPDPHVTGASSTDASPPSALMQPVIEQPATATHAEQPRATTEPEPRRVDPPTPARMAPPRSSFVPNPMTPKPRRTPARIGGGLALLATGAGLTAGMVASLDARGEVVRSYRALEASIHSEGRDPTPHEMALVDQMHRHYGRLSFAAGVAGATATASVLAGIVLLAATPRRARTLAGPWAAGHLAGLVVSGHF